MCKKTTRAQTLPKLPSLSKAQLSAHDAITEAMEATFLKLRKQHRRTRDVKAELKALYFVRHLVSDSINRYAKLHTSVYEFHKLWNEAYRDAQLLKKVMKEVAA